MKTTPIKKLCKYQVLELLLLFAIKKQYLAEVNGNSPTSGNAMTPEQQEIQSLKKQLWRSNRDNEILKKATALFVADNQRP
jgi:transposase-like protein